ncbi:MAG: CHAD domain-containing protein [Marmoricola sp.]
MRPVMIHERLAQLIERLPIYDSRIRRREPGGVHKMRVTLRRLRSLLATFAPLFDRDVVVSLRDELSWIAGELAGARDAEVVRTRLNGIATTPEELAVARRIKKALGAAEVAAMERSVAALDSERYSEVLRRLNGFATDPPWNPHVDATSDGLLRRRIRRDWKRLRRRVERASEAAGGSVHDATLHEVRKAAKRLRYSAETLVPASGEDAKRLARGAKRIQTELGEVQDSVVSQALLRTMAEDAEPGEAFVLGRLQAHDRFLAASAEARYAKAWAKLSRRKNRRWLK